MPVGMGEAWGKLGGGAWHPKPRTALSPSTPDSKTALSPATQEPQDPSPSKVTLQWYQPSDKKVTLHTGHPRRHPKPLITKVTLHGNVTFKPRCVPAIPL